MTNFGKLLRTFREQCHNPENGGKLSQDWLGRLLREEMGTRFSGATISYWESGKSKIPADDRLLLTSLVKILKQYGGIKTPADANLLLEAGNYRSLNDDEKQKIFPDEPPDVLAKSIAPESTEKTTPAEAPARVPSLFDFRDLEQDKDAAPPAWSLISARLMRRISDRLETWDATHLFLWLVVWILAYILLTPAFRWPFHEQKFAVSAMSIYVCATFALPLCIGILTKTKGNPVWKDRVGDSSRLVRLYTYQGAAIGFHVGYFGIFAFHLIAHYLQVQLPMWFQFLLAGFPLFMGAVGANVVPDNLWRAYQRLSLRDGWIFFVFVLVGPFWGWVFFQYYSWLTSPILGAGIIITALILSSLLMKHQNARST